MRRIENISRNSRSNKLCFEKLEARELLAVLSGDGGQGGTTQSTPLDPGLNLVRFQWENYSIPDEFQILHQGKRIAGNVGLQSGGDSGSTVVVSRVSSEQLTVKVTAPLQGTAWNFTVEVIPFELNVSGFVGDVFKVDIVQSLRNAGVSLADADFKADGFALQSLTNNRGKVAEIDNFQGELKKGVFYFVPKVSGTILDYLEARNDDGVGDSELTVTNNGHEFKIKLNVTKGASTSGTNAVTFGGKKLDVYRQQQRLSYLGFPGASGSPLSVDGIEVANTNWARKMFSVATNPAAVRPKVVNSDTQYFKTNINNSNAPVWNQLDNIQGVNIVSARNYGIHTTGEVFTDASIPLTDIIISTGASLSNGTAPPSTSHDAGRGVDVDNIPGPYLFQSVGYNGVAGGFVKAPGPAGSIVVSSGTTYAVGNTSSAADRANGVRTSQLASSTTATLANSLEALGLLVYSQAETSVRAMLEAFTGAGATSALYNDPRFLGEVINGVEIRFYVNHFNHMHFNIPNPITNGPPANRIAGLSNTPLIAGLLISSDSFIDLGRPDSDISVSGILDSATTEQVYRFEIGDVVDDYPEREYFDTPRDLTSLLSGLSANADLEIIEDLDGSGTFESDEVLYSSVTDGTTNETINAPQLPSGEYFVRVIGNGNTTTFNLSLSLAPLAVPADSAGNTLVMARDLGTVIGTINVSDFVGEVDTVDYYRIVLGTTSDVSISLTGLTQGDDSLVLGSDGDGDGKLDAGEWLSLSDVEGEDNESVLLKFLPAGEYFVGVGRVSGNSNYDMTVTATVSGLPSDPAGDVPATALDLGVLTSATTVNGFVGDVDAVDVYRFSLSSTMGMEVMLTNLGADADIELYRDTSGDGVLDSDELLTGSYNDSLEADAMTLAGLAAGDYYLIVQQYEGNTAYELTLSPQTASGADLKVSQQIVTPTPNLGDQFSFTVSVTNNGPDTATNVVLVDAFTAGLTILRATGTDASVQTFGNTVRATLTRLASGATEVITISARSFITGDLVGSVTVESDTVDYNPTNDSIVQSIFVSPIVSPNADLELSQSVSNRNPSVGDQISITLSLSNKGPGTATVIRVGDKLPAGLSYLSSTATLGSYNATTGEWTVGNIPPDVTVLLNINVKVTTALSVVNAAEVLTVDESDPDSTPNNGVPTEDDYAALTIDARPVGISLVPAALVVGRNRLEIRNATPGGVVNLVRGLAPGQTTMDRFGVTLEVADGIIVAQAVVQPDGRAHFLYNIKDFAELNSIRLQAFEQAPVSQLTNVISASTGKSIAANTSASTVSSGSQGESVSSVLVAQDVNSDGQVSPFDALLVINSLNRSMGEGQGPANEQQSFKNRLDVDQDGSVSPLDALLVLNYLNRRSAILGDGEASWQSIPTESNKKASYQIDDELLVVIATDISEASFDSELREKGRRKR
jgi:uncharacterized repeat protein (TIGR01451 family)